MKTLKFRDYKNLNENKDLCTTYNIDESLIDFDTMTYQGSLSFNGLNVDENVPVLFNHITGGLMIKNCLNFKSMRAFKNLKTVEKIIISNTGIESLEGLENIKKLEKLWVFASPLKNLKGLDNLESVEKDFWITDCQIKRLDDLKSLNSVGYFQIKRTHVSSLRTLSSCKKIDKLDCPNNQIFILDNYGQEWEIGTYTDNPLVINKIATEIKKQNHPSVINGFADIWYDIDKEDFLELLEYLNSVFPEESTILNTFYQDIIETAEKLNVDLKNKTPKNWYDIYKSKTKDLDDIGFDF